MLSHSRLFVTVLVALCLASFIGCASTEESSSNSNTTSHVVVIGGVFGLTGGDIDLDVPTLLGAQLAVQELNATGGLLGDTVKMHVADCKRDSADAASAVTQIASTHEGTLIGFIGLSDTDPALGAGKAATKLNLPFVTAGATYPRLPQLTGRSMFLACFGDNVQAAAGAEFAYNILRKRRVFIIYNHDRTYTVKLLNYFQHRWEELDNNIAGITSYGQSESDFSRQVADIKSSTADFIYAAAMPEDVEALTNQLRAAGVTIPIVGGDGWDIPTFPADVGSAGDSVYYSTHAFLGDISAAMKKFSASYKTMFGDTPTSAFAALGYDAVMLLADAAKRAGSVVDGGKTIGALEATQNFLGVTGSISFTPDSHVPKKTVSIIGVMNAAAHLEAAFVPASIPAP
jgi:branched-chain amino acid transport system substrate-binding protein